MPGSDVSTTPSKLVRFSAVNTAERRLFCLPFAGGGPAAYRRWPGLLPPDVEVVAVVLPGRDPASRMPPPDSIGELVAATHEALGELDEREPLPFAVFGHSLGALIAFELTVALERSGGPAPSRLFVSGRRPPDEPHRGDLVHGLADEQFLDAMQDRYGGVPDVVRNEPDLLALFLPPLRADIHALETHVPLDGAVVRCPLHVYGGAHDNRPAPTELAGWQRVANSEITVRTFEGDHFYLTSTGPASSGDALVADIAANLTSESVGQMR